MIEAGEASPGAALEAAVPALRAELRLDGEAADVELGRCLRAAAGLCEAYTGTALIEREVVETLEAGGRWAVLAKMPVRSITGVTELGGVALPPADYRLGIGGDGTGAVRATGAVRVTYRAGLAPDWARVPEPLALGLVRLAGHLWTVRDGDAAPPAAVAALWSPWRRVRLGGPAVLGEPDRSAGVSTRLAPLGTIGVAA